MINKFSKFNHLLTLMVNICIVSNETPTIHLIPLGALCSLFFYLFHIYIFYILM